MTKIAVIGTGYVGLTTEACFAHLGHDVICADIDEDKIKILLSGRAPFVEDGLDRLVEEGLENGNLRFVVGAKNAVADCEVAFLCVPTPQRADESADLSFIETATQEIAALLPPGTIVVNKSTVPVGSTRVVEAALQRPDVRVVSNPEFLREGSAVGDFLNPDRIVIGSEDQAAAIKVSSLYLGISAPIVVTDPASAETIKYAANAFLATKLSFVNAIAAICEGVGADISDVMRGLGYDNRIGPEFLRPGPGWGGSCLPKDTRAMVRIAKDAGYDFKLLRGVIEINEDQFDRVVDKLEAAAGGSLQGRNVAVWGLTFKAGTDDLRDSPSLPVISGLVGRGAVVRAYDPTVAVDWDDAPAGVEIVGGPLDACNGADVLAVLTEWGEFRMVSPRAVGEQMENSAVVDARNCLDRALWQRHGFDYRGIGR